MSCGQNPIVYNDCQWLSDAARKYADDCEVSQIVAVQYLGGSDATVRLLEKHDGRRGAGWTETLQCRGLVGKCGLGKTREGDGKTPVGDFGIITAFGIKGNPGTILPYLDVDEDTWCCGDPEFYNRIIDASETGHHCIEGEHLIDYSPEYNYGLFLDYNKSCTLGLGSAIFFHCTGAKPYTGGCVAVAESDMVAILKALQPGARVIIDYLSETAAEKQ